MFLTYTPLICKDDKVQLSKDFLSLGNHGNFPDMSDSHSITVLDIILIAYKVVFNTINCHFKHLCMGNSIMQILQSESEW